MQNSRSLLIAALVGLGPALTACVPAQDLDAGASNYEAANQKRALAIADPALRRRARNNPHILCMVLRTKYDPKPVAPYGMFGPIDYGLFASAEFAEGAMLQSVVDAMPSPDNAAIARYYRTVADQDSQAALKLLEVVEQQEITCLAQSYADHENRIVSAANQPAGVRSFSWENQTYSRRDYMRAVFNHMRENLTAAKSAGQTYRGIRAALEKPAASPVRPDAQSADASQADAATASAEQATQPVPPVKAAAPRPAEPAPASADPTQSGLFTAAVARQKDLAALGQRFAVLNGSAPAAIQAPGPSSKTPVPSPGAPKQKTNPLSGSEKTKSTEAAKSN